MAESELVDQGKLQRLHEYSEQSAKVLSTTGLGIKAIVGGFCLYTGHWSFGLGVGLATGAWTVASGLAIIAAILGLGNFAYQKMSRDQEEEMKQGLMILEHDLEAISAPDYDPPHSDSYSSMYDY